MVHNIGNNVATCSQRVFMTLAELGIKDFTIYSPDVMSGEHKVYTAPTVLPKDRVLMSEIETSPRRETSLWPYSSP